MMKLTRQLAALALAVGLAGCASNVEHWQPNYQDRTEVSDAVQQMHQAQQRQLRGESVMQDLEGPYLGGGETQPVNPDHDLPPDLARNVSLFTSHPQTLEETAAWLADTTGAEVRVQAGDATNNTVAFNYEGPMAGLLNSIANRYDAAWKYDDGVITLSHVVTRVYELAMIPGDVETEMEMTTQSDDQTGGVSQESSYTQAQGGMTTNISLKRDPWERVEDAMEDLVPDSSTYSVNRTTMAIIVTAPPSVQERVSEYVDGFNNVLTRQVALNIQVYRFDVTDSRTHGFNLDAVYESLQDSYRINVSGPSLGGVEGGGFSANLLESADSRFAGSSALIRALNQWGETSLVTSGTGMILNGQVFPINAVNRQGYLAKASSTQVVNAGVSGELEPGIVTTGFSMQVVPYLRGNNTLLLQYSFSLSSLLSIDSKTSGDATIEVPNVDDRSFIQRSLMPLGSTLVLAGFQRDTDSLDNASGVSGYNRSHDQRKQMIFVTITASKA